MPSEANISIPKRIERVEMRNITKRFPGVVANENVSFDVSTGEVHALLGENGAGKSTLMRQLYGLYRPDQGEILIDGQPVVFHSPSDAIRAGIGMIMPKANLSANICRCLKSFRPPICTVPGCPRRWRWLRQTFIWVRTIRCLSCSTMRRAR